jgi:hypothetical protein
VANQKEFFGEGFKGDKTFLLIILLAKWVYPLGFNIKALTIVVAFGIKLVSFFMRALIKSTLNFMCDIVSTNLLNQVCALM